jgi:hypothetical protein
MGVLGVGTEVRMEALVAVEVGTMVGAEESGWLTDVRAGASGQMVRVRTIGGQVGVWSAASGWPVGATQSVSMIMAGETPEGGCMSWRVSMSERPC